MFKNKLHLAIFLAIGSLCVVIPGQAKAVSGADWQAGRIIDDAIFYNKSAMNVQQIQDFLNAKVPTCDTYGTKTSEYGGGTRAQYGAAHGAPAPYTCLKDYFENTATKENNLEGRGIPAGAKSAAQIIWDAAQQYEINPQVLIVLLQKEQAIVTDEWPFPVQYRSATGYGCPDTAACDTSYYGFYNQVQNAARQFRLYANNPNGYNHVANQNNNIRWSPNASCGSSSVFIQNQGTASLYNYTPYQPNQAALNNLYGTGDSCSAYGNRNFWRYFVDWFGSTTAAPYVWQPVGQTVFTDNTKTQPLGWNATLLQGQRAYVVVTVKNNGSQTWVKNGAVSVKLATWGPQDRRSAMCDQTWAANCSRVVTHNEDSVAPGQYATFEFWVQSPQQAANYAEVFNLVAEGYTWMPNAGLMVGFDVKPPTYTAAAVHQTVYTDSTKWLPLGWDATVYPGQRVYASITVKNTGNVPWVRDGSNPVKLATWDPFDRQSEFCSGWLSGCTRVALPNEATVNPGQFATFDFWMQTPDREGNFREQFNLVAENHSWMNLGGLSIGINSTKGNFTWQPLHQTVYTDSTKTTALGWNATLAPNQTAYVVLTVKNTGNVPWVKNASYNPPKVRVGTWGPQDRISPFSYQWYNHSRPTEVIIPDMVLPGTITTMEFPIKAPSQPGVYNEVYNLVADGRTWMNPGALVQFTVQ
ncbi:MAG TPA: hypothetical protein VLA77_00965 [Candidatus Saccharimonadales bacterium]|nr:hypothetical protein [Candidatus Saccharimonadales bacterium]